MSRLRVSLYSVLQVIVLLTLSQSAFSQTSSARIIDPPPEGAVVYCCAYMVLCEGASEYVAIKVQSTVSQEDACQKAYNKALAGCEKGVKDIYQLQLPPRLCMVLGSTAIMATARMSTMSVQADDWQVQADAWQVTASLCYYDGTIGATIPVVGATRCQVLSDARELLCEIKKATYPCKPAYMKFCIVKSPCCCARCR